MVSVRRCVALRQHQYQLRRANKPKTGGRKRNSGGVCGSSGAGAPERRDGRPEGEPEPEEQVFLMGEAVSGRSVQRKEGDGYEIGELVGRTRVSWWCFVFA